MLDSLFKTSIPLLELVLRAFLVYGFIVTALRFSGKRQLGQMGTSEFVAILLVSNAVQNSMNGGDNSLVGGMLSATSIMIMSWIIAWMNFRNEGLRNLIEGTPRVLIRHGKIIDKNLTKELISTQELKALLRRQGIHSVKEVQLASIEPNGTLTIERNEP